jgi:hypothetical protein
MGRLFDYLSVISAILGSFFCLMSIITHETKWAYLFLCCNLAMLFFILKTRFPRA